MRFTTLLAVPVLFASVSAAVEEVTLEDYSPTSTSNVLGKRTFCLNYQSILNCVLQGKAVKPDCSCSNSCDCISQHNCESGGGLFNPSTCGCSTASGSGNNNNNNGYNWWWNQQPSGWTPPSISIGGSFGWGKRDLESRKSSRFCPSPYYECPVPKNVHPAGSTFTIKGKMYQCLDIMSDVESCGGCDSEGLGQDCTSIDFAEEVRCGEGRCIVDSCEAGWIPSPDHSECIVDPKARKGLFTQQYRP